MIALSFWIMVQWASVCFTAAHPPFKQAEEFGHDIRQHKIDQRRVQQRLQVTVVHGGQLVRLVGQLIDADRVEHRGLLDHGDKLVAHRGERDLDRLRQNDVDHLLGPAHAQRVGGLGLAAVHGLQARPDQLRHVGAGVDDERDHAKRHPGEPDAHLRQSVDDHQDLYEQRGAPDERDVDVEQDAQRPDARPPENRDQQPQQRAEQHRKQRQLQRDAHALHERAELRDHDFPDLGKVEHGLL